MILALRLVVPRVIRFIRRRRQSAQYQPLAVEEDEEVPQPSTTYQPSQGLVSDVIAHIRSMQALGKWLFGLEVIRLLCIAGLLGLSIYAVIQAESPPELGTLDTELEVNKKWGGKHRKKKHRHRHPKPVFDYYSHLEWAEFGVCTYYVCMATYETDTNMLLALHSVRLVPTFNTRCQGSSTSSSVRPHRHTSLRRIHALCVP